MLPPKRKARARPSKAIRDAAALANRDGLRGLRDADILAIAEAGLLDIARLRDDDLDRVHALLSPTTADDDLDRTYGQDETRLTRIASDLLSLGAKK